MTIPGWSWGDSGLMRATPDGRWLLVIQSTPRQGHLGLLAAVDWEQKKVVREIPLSWNATTMELSADGSRLLVGASNRSIYEFDVKQLCTVP
jgi:tricorn protease-like protein